MSEKRYEYCDEIAAIVDMSKLTIEGGIEGGEEMTTNDVVERLNQLETENAALQHDINGKQGAILNYQYVVTHLEDDNATLKREFVEHLMVQHIGDMGMSREQAEEEVALLTTESAEKQFASSLSKRTDPLTDDEKRNALLTTEEEDNG